MSRQITAFVPIKLNSQRLPNKNILPLGNKPLCSYIFSQLLEIESITDVCVFCSDESIMRFLPKGVRFVKRDESLDGDLVKGLDIYQSFLKTVDSDIYILAHTTAPFLRRQSIENALQSVLEGKFDSALSVQKKQTFIWYKGNPLNYNLNDIPRTQDIEPVFVETSGFYIFQRKHLKEFNRRVGFNPYFQELEDVEAIDIDTKEDYNFALKIMENDRYFERI